MCKEYASAETSELLFIRAFLSTDHRLYRTESELHGAALICDSLDTTASLSYYVDSCSRVYNVCLASSQATSKGNPGPLS